MSYINFGKAGVKSSVEAAPHELVKYILNEDNQGNKKSFLTNNMNNASNLNADINSINSSNVPLRNKLNKNIEIEEASPLRPESTT